MIAKKDQTVENVRAAITDPKQRDLKLEDISVRLLRKDPSLAEAYISAGRVKQYPIHYLRENNIPVNRELCLKACVIAGETITHMPEEMVDHDFLRVVVSERPYNFEFFLAWGQHKGIYPYEGVSKELFELVKEAVLPRAYLREQRNIVLSDHLSEEEKDAIRHAGLSPSLNVVPREFMIEAVQALEEKMAAQENEQPATSAKETMKAFRGDVDKLLIENGIDDDKAFAISDAIYECAEHHFFAKQPMPVLDPEKVCVSIALVRERACEDKLWVDNLKVLFDAAEFQELISTMSKEDAALALLRKYIRKGLASAKGWKQICFASRDYNWGDCANDAYDQLVDGEAYPSTESVEFKVNQDEHLAPDDVPVKVCIRFKWKEERTVGGVLDMSDGSLECEAIEAMEHDIRDIESAQVIFEDGAVPLDPEEDFLRLTII